MNRTLRERVMDEADLCRNEGADDIARLLDEVAAALDGHAKAEQVRQPLREVLLSYADKCDCEELSGHVVAEELRAIAALADQAQAEPVACDECVTTDRCARDNQCQRTDKPLYTAPQPAAQPVAVPEWQPIETAPKDGTRVLLYREGFAESMAAGWWNNTGCGGADWIPVNGSVWPGPTHWMPLPAAPKVQQ